MPVEAAAGFLVLALMLARPATTQAQHSMAGMGAHREITIPAGAGYTVADVEFMQGMIAHHAQAIYMSRLAEAHGANPRVLKLANKIDQSQVAEIRIMQDWLRRNGQFAPDTSAWRTMLRDQSARRSSARSRVRRPSMASANVGSVIAAVL